MRETAIFIAPGVTPTFNDENNSRGYETEQRVGKILAAIPYVKEVIQVERDSDEDKDMVDLVVKLVDGFVTPQVFVQVKSSSVGVNAFFDRVGKRMREEGSITTPLSGDEEHRRRMKWIRARKLIVINAGLRNGERVTDEYIADKFFRELVGITEDIKATAV